MFKRLTIIVCLFLINIQAVVTEISDFNKFNDTIKSGKSVVKFYTDNCSYCTYSAPMFNNLSDKYKDIHFITVKLFVKGVDKRFSQLFPAIRGVPAFGFFKDGKKVGGPIVGFEAGKTENAITARINSL